MNKNVIKPYIIINNKPISYIEGEYYAPLRCVPDISMFYQISNYGNIWDEVIGSVIDFGYDIFGHVIVALETKNGPVIERVDRLMLMTFRPCENMDKLYVKHTINSRTNYIDLKDEPDGIYWVNHPVDENVYITNSYNNTQEIDTEKAINCCLLLQAGYDATEISNILKMKRSIVDNIKSRRSWRNISCIYSW